MNDYMKQVSRWFDLFLGLIILFLVIVLLAEQGYNPAITILSYLTSGG